MLIFANTGIHVDLLSRREQHMDASVRWHDGAGAAQELCPGLAGLVATFATPSVIPANAGIHVDLLSRREQHMDASVRWHDGAEGSDPPSRLRGNDGMQKLH